MFITADGLQCVGYGFATQEAGGEETERCVAKSLSE